MRTRIGWRPGPRVWSGWAGRKLLTGMALVLLAAACAPDPGRIRAQYPHDFTFVSGYYSEQQALPHWEVGQIELVDQYAVLASRDIRGGNIQVDIIDVQEPASPRPVARYESRLTTIDDMIVVEELVFLAGHSGGIEVVDISDPAGPVQAGFYEHQTALPTAMAAVDGYLYYYAPAGQVQSQTPRWHILDITDGRQIRLVAEVADLLEPKAVSNHTIIAGRFGGTAPLSRIQIIDVGEPAEPVVLSDTQLEIQLYGIEVRGDLAYVSTGSGVQVLDVSNPRVPLMVRDDLNQIGSFAQMDMDDNVLVGDFIFALALEPEGLSVEVSPLARLDLEEFNNTFCGPGTQLAGRSDEIKAALCSTPSALVSSGTNDLVVANGHVYLATKRTGLLIFQLPDDAPSR